MKKRILLYAFLLTCATDLTAQEEFKPTWSLKNNLLYDLTLTPNIGVEVKTGGSSTM